MSPHGPAAGGPGSHRIPDHPRPPSGTGRRTTARTAPSGQPITQTHHPSGNHPGGDVTPGPDSTDVDSQQTTTPAVPGVVVPERVDTIVGAAVRTFEEFDLRRRQLLAAAELIEATWAEHRSARSSVLDAGAADDDGPVAAELHEARVRLSRTLIEVGVFGEIKRGKSTLLNALLGTEVSTTDVTPETAVPVYVEPGDPSATVVRADGSTAEVSPAEARRMASQKHMRLRRGPEVVRVIQRLRAPLLHHGVRLIDTPGLSDPAMTELFEKLTLAELDRVAAAIVVLLYPPGIAAGEVDLLASLGGRRVDKTFLVCNFYSGPWEDPGVRHRIESQIRTVVAEGAGLDPGAVRLYAVNAAQAWEALRRGDRRAWEASGVAELARDLEAYLAGGALEALAAAAIGHLRAAARLVRAAIDQRLAVLEDPERLAGLRAERTAVVARLEATAASIASRLEARAAELGDELAALAREPFEWALEELEVLARRSELGLLENRLAMRQETMLSRVQTVAAAGYDAMREQARTELLGAFGIDPGVDTGEVPSLELVGASGLLPDDDGLSTSLVVLGAGLGAVGGGALAGGAGVALLSFMGPAGFLVGAAIGALIGAGAGLAAGALAPPAKEALRARLGEAAAEAERRARLLADGLAARLRDQVDRTLSAASAEDLAELAALDRIISDDTERSRQRLAAHRLRDRLDALGLT